MNDGVTVSKTINMTMKNNTLTDKIRILQNTEYSEETGLPVNLTLDIRLPADFPEKYKASVISVADLCKVKKSIANPPNFEIKTTQIQ